MRLFASLLIASLPSLALAQTSPQVESTVDARTLDTVEVVGIRRPLSTFPGAVTVIDGETLRDGQRQVNLSESLQRVPGVTVLDRGNYAQDLQVQSRGFGARSTFGIRGIKLVVDGIPSSAADGQGQAANFPLGALDRIEVLRGPLALQYGNAAGGAIVAQTELQTQRGWRVDGWGGGDDSWRVGTTIDGLSADVSRRWRLHGSHFRTGGHRPHAAAERSQLHFVGEWSPYRGNRLRWVAGSVVQPWTDDPLGLTRPQWEADPYGTDPVAERFDARKRIGNHQAGVRWEVEYAGDRDLWIGGHGIRRDIVQFLAIPPVAQAAPTSAGGVIDLGRQSWGVDAGHRWRFARGAVAVGVEAGWLDEARRGYENFVGGRLGVRGRLRRNEENRVRNRDAYVIGDWWPAKGWNLLGAIRHSRLSFASDDRFIAIGNGDDSGRFDFSGTAASLGIARAFTSGEIFASVGRGFETPTVTELAYRPDGAGGFNQDLGASRARSAEIGARWRLGTAEASVAVYRIDGEGEIVPARSSGGRTSFANAGGTRREGIEASLSGELGDRWSYALAANLIRARFVDDYRFDAGAQGGEQLIEAGKRIPGIPRADGFAELAWRDAGDRLRLAVESRLVASIAVDDRNSDAAPGRAIVALRGEWRPRQAEGWSAFARIDNLFDRDYVGSVIVNDRNGRHFEPGAGRTFTFGIGYRR
ncbi:TonB-dependent receptor family protein [Luteimonas vadosa]|uniref:TonB-dependent receptor n=1 Tax=Luteimonas vadosa TaxID=1165507 RepID=A0ABP9E333_9GAMM